MIIRRFKGIGICFLFIFLGAQGNAYEKRYEIKTVVIDAGHGGHDVGCLGSIGKEKDVALAISLKLGKLIEENYPQVKVVYTRKNDVFVELHERAEIANRNKADLFICIHANSGGGAYGTETFVLGLHRAEENLAVSKRENSAILMEKDYKTKYAGFDPNSPEANIIFRLHQNTYLQQSLLFAAKVQDQLNDFAGRLNRGVKQAGLLVLARTTMPGVLIETGFLTNRNEEKYLLSSKGQNQISTAIYRAFKEYKLDMEEVPEGSKLDILKSDTTPGNTKKMIKDSSASVSQPIPKKNQVNADKKEVEIRPVVDTITKPKTTKEIPSEKVNVTSADAKKVDSLILETDVKPNETKKIKENNKETIEKKITENTADVFFTIQLGAVDKPTHIDRDRFKKVIEITERVSEDGITRFTKGIYVTLEKAISGQAEMRSKGFKDAFVTAYNKNKRITVKEATTLLQGKQ